MPQVSVIIPVYGVEKYIERCARSLFEQTLEDMEFIFVNDCTKDSSIAVLRSVLKDYPSRQSQTIIYDMEKNSGVAAARAQGQLLASGDYVIHCDSDDWVEKGLYQSMYETAVADNADVVICPITDEYKDSSKIREYQYFPKDGKELLVNWYAQSIGMFLWNKLVRRIILSENELLPFEGINMWEDNGLMLRVFYYVDTISYIHTHSYHYNRANAGAVTKGYGIDSVRQMISCAKHIEDFFVNKDDYCRFENTVNAIKFYARINLVSDRFSLLKEYRNTFPESRSIIRSISLSAFSIKGKIRFAFVLFHLEWLFVLLFKVVSLSKTK